DFGAIELAGLHSIERSKVVDVDFAIDLWRVILRTAFPEQFCFGAFAFGEDDEFAADPLLLGLPGDLLLQLHQVTLAGFDGASWELRVECMGLRAFFVGVVEDSEPVELRFVDELLQKIKVRGGLAGKADDEGGAQCDPGNSGPGFFDGLEEDFSSGAALHALEHIRRGMLQRYIEVFADVVVLRDGFEQAASDAIRIGVKEPEPTKAFDLCDGLEKLREAILEAKVFAVAGGVLADERDLLHSGGDKTLCLRYDRFKATRAKLAAKIRNDTEGAWVVAAFGDFDVRRGATGGDQPRRVF